MATNTQILILGSTAYRVVLGDLQRTPINDDGTFSVTEPQWSYPETPDAECDTAMAMLGGAALHNALSRMVEFGVPNPDTNLSQWEDEVLTPAEKALADSSIARPL